MYSGSGQLGKLCAKSFKAADYKLQRGEEIGGLRMGTKGAMVTSYDKHLAGKGRSSSSEAGSSPRDSSEEYDSDGDGGWSRSGGRSLHKLRSESHISRKLAEMKDGAALKAKARKQRERENRAAKKDKKKAARLPSRIGAVSFESGPNGPVDAMGVSYDTDGGGSPSPRGDTGLRSLSLLSIGEQCEAWVAAEQKRNLAVRAPSGVAGGGTFTKLKILDRQSFRSPSSRNHGGGKSFRSASARNHNRAMMQPRT